MIKVYESLQHYIANKKNYFTISDVINLSYKKHALQLWEAEVKVYSDNVAVKFIDEWSWMDIYDNDNNYIGLFRVNKIYKAYHAGSRATVYKLVHAFSTMLDDAFLVSDTGMTDEFTFDTLNSMALINFMFSKQSTRHWNLVPVKYSGDNSGVQFTRQNGLLKYVYEALEEMGGKYSMIFNTTEYPWKAVIIEAKDKVDCRVREEYNLLEYNMDQDYAPYYNRLYVYGEKDILGAPIENRREPIKEPEITSKMSQKQIDAAWKRYNEAVKKRKEEDAKRIADDKAAWEKYNADYKAWSQKQIKMQNTRDAALEKRRAEIAAGTRPSGGYFANLPPRPSTVPPPEKPHLQTRETDTKAMSIGEVNDGKPYIEDAEEVASRGVVSRVVELKDIRDPQLLMDTAQRIFDARQDRTIDLQLTAIELNKILKEKIPFDDFHLGQHLLMQTKKDGEPGVAGKDGTDGEEFEWNLLREGDTKIVDSTDYLVNTYDLDEPIPEGTLVTLVVRVKGNRNPDADDLIFIHNSSGSNPALSGKPFILVQEDSKDTFKTYSRTGYWSVGQTSNTSMRLYWLGRNGEYPPVSIEWVKLVYGDNPTMEFTPAKSEIYGKDGEPGPQGKPGVDGNFDLVIVGESKNDVYGNPYDIQLELVEVEGSAGAGSKPHVVSPTDMMLKKIQDLQKDILYARKSADGKNTIYTGEVEPPAPEINDIWYKTAIDPVTGEATTEMHIWNGVIWVNPFESLKQAMAEVRENEKELEMLREEAEKSAKELEANLELAKTDLMKDVAANRETINNLNKELEVKLTDLQTSIDNANAAAEKAVEEAQKLLSGNIDQLKTELTKKIVEEAENVESKLLSATDDKIATATADLLAQAKEIGNGVKTELNTQIGELSATIAETKTQADGLTTKVSEVKQTVDGFSVRLLESEETSEANKTKIAQIQNSVNSLSSTLSDITTTTDGMESRLTTVEQTSTELKTLIESTQENLGGKISSLNSRIDTAEGSIATIKKTSNDNSSSISTINKRVSTAEGTISTISTNVDGLTTKTNTIQSTVDANKATIASQKKEIDEAGTKITTLTSSLTQTQGQVSGIITNYAKKTDLKGLATEEYTQTQIDAKAGEINQTISSQKKEIDTTIAGIKARPTYTIGSDGYWYKDGVKTHTLAKGVAGKDGADGGEFGWNLLRKGDTKIVDSTDYLVNTYDLDEPIPEQAKVTLVVRVKGNRKPGGEDTIIVHNSSGSNPALGNRSYVLVQEDSKDTFKTYSRTGYWSVGQTSNTSMRLYWLGGDAPVSIEWVKLVYGDKPTMEFAPAKSEIYGKDAHLYTGTTAPEDTKQMWFNPDDMTTYVYLDGKWVDMDKLTKHQIETNVQTINTLKQTDESIKSEIAQIKTNAETESTKLNSLERDLTGTKSTVSTLTKDLTSAKESISSNTTQITQANDKIQTIVSDYAKKTDLEGYVNETTVSTIITQKVGELTTTLQADVNKTKGDVSTLTTKINTTTQTVDGMSSKIATYENYGNGAGVINTLNFLQRDISSLSSDIQNKDYMSTINQQAGEILFKVTKTSDGKQRGYLSITEKGALMDKAFIKTAHISDASVTNAKILSLSADKLTAGTIDARLIRVTNLDANAITTGTISGTRSSWNLNTGRLQNGWLAEDIPSWSTGSSYTSVVIEDGVFTFRRQGKKFVVLDYKGLQFWGEQYQFWRGETPKFTENGDGMTEEFGRFTARWWDTDDLKDASGEDTWTSAVGVKNLSMSHIDKSTMTISYYKESANAYYPYMIFDNYKKLPFVKTPITVSKDITFRKDIRTANDLVIQPVRFNTVKTDNYASGIFLGKDKDWGLLISAKGVWWVSDNAPYSGSGKSQAEKKASMLRLNSTGDRDYQGGGWNILTDYNNKGTK